MSLRDNLRRMALWRPRSPKALVCPACDAALAPEVAGNAEPRCTGCGTVLWPVKVAGLWRRSAATLVDAVLLLFTAGPLAWLVAAAVLGSLFLRRKAE